MIGKLSVEIGIYSSDWFPPIIPLQDLNIFKVENLSIFFFKSELSYSTCLLKCDTFTEGHISGNQ